jgi:ABC-2 type transport system ATP-binding protein
MTTAAAMPATIGGMADSSNSGAAVSLRGVSKSYGSVRAVQEVALDVPRGQTIAVLGPNGAGKSTTLGMLTALVRPDTGSVRVCGLPPRAAVEGGRIAAMLQDAGLMPGVTVGQLVRLVASMYPRSLPVTAALELAGLTDVAGHPVDRLSGGQVQRTKLALVTVTNADVLVLDEPTRALDVAARRDFWAAMRALAAQGRTVVFATHYLDEVAENADRVVVLSGGRVVADGDPDDIRGAASVSTVTFSLAAQSAVDGLTELPGVRSVARSGARVTLESVDADATVRALAASAMPWRDLGVAPPSLDDSYLALTAPATSTRETS